MSACDIRRKGLLPAEMLLWTKQYQVPHRQRLVMACQHLAEPRRQLRRLQGNIYRGIDKIQGGQLEVAQPPQHTYREGTLGIPYLKWEEIRGAMTDKAVIKKEHRHDTMQWPSQLDSYSLVNYIRRKIPSAIRNLQNLQGQQQSTLPPRAVIREWFGFGHTSKRRKPPKVAICKSGTLKI